MTVTNEIKKLEKAFDKLNEHYYGGKLPKVVIHFYPNRTNKPMYGFITTKKVWTDGKKCEYEINICADTPSEGKKQVYETLLHEMAHLYNMENGINDISNNGYYHNKRFKETAEAHGLKAGKNKYGWSNTTLDDEAEEFVEKFDDIEVRYISPQIASNGADGGEEEEKTPKKRTTFKHVCPVCGAIARTTKEDIRLICGDCEEPMDIVD